MYEESGWQVAYKGIIDGFEYGRDLICMKGNEHLIVQAKCWSKHKEIRKNVYQLYASATHYRMQLDMPINYKMVEVLPKDMKKQNIKAVMCINSNLSETAREVAKYLSIEKNRSSSQRYIL